MGDVSAPIDITARTLFDKIAVVAQLSKPTRGFAAFRGFTWQYSGEEVSYVHRRGFELSSPTQEELARGFRGPKEREYWASQIISRATGMPAFHLNLLDRSHVVDALSPQMHEELERLHAKTLESGRVRGWARPRESAPDIVIMIGLYAALSPERAARVTPYDTPLSIAR